MSEGYSHNRYTLAAGFTAMLALMVLSTLIALNRMEALNHQLHTVVTDHNAKRAILKQMRSTARERVLSIHHMLVIEDPFEQDEEALAIDEYGTEFTLLRHRLLEMNLKPAELILIDQQGSYAAEAVPIQRQAVEYIKLGQMTRARQLLIEQVIPLQERGLSFLLQLEAMQESAAHLAMEEANDTYRNTRNLLFGLGLGTTLLGLLIAYFTVFSSLRNERQLFREKDRAKVTLQSIGDAVITTFANGRIESLNPVAETLTGWPCTKARGRDLFDVLRLQTLGGKPRNLTQTQQLVEMSLDKHLTRQCHLLTHDGNLLPIEFTANAIHGREGGVAGLVITLRDISEQQKAADQLSHEARHDPLTNLLNRREFERRLEESISGVGHGENSHILCYLDLDRFKVVNDTCGHHAGDVLLKQISARMKSKVRGNDLFARIGGDEFAILLERCPLEKAMTIAEDIRHDINNYVFVWDNRSFHIGVSIGLVPIKGTNSMSDIQAAADAACYAAKHEGRNRVHVYRDPQRESRESNHSPWLDRLHTALHENQLSLYCQRIEPLNPLHDNRELCEMQLRLIDESSQPIPPMAFIPTAERHNLMPVIDRWVLRHTCALIPQIDNPSMVYCLNLSLQTVHSPGFIDALQTELRRHAIRADQLCFEISEKDLMAEMHVVKEFCRQLKDIGCRTSIDDMGRCISNYDHLRDLPIDYIKIDGHLIGKLASNHICQVQVKAMTDIAHHLGIGVIAEMVEDYQLIEELGNLGVNYAQGFGIAKPRPVNGQFNIDPRLTLTPVLEGSQAT